MAKQLSYGSVQICFDDILGVGSYGKVCKGKCGQLPCAVKLLHDTIFQQNDPGINSFTKSFEQECQFLSTIKHPNIVQCLGTITNPESGRPVLLMELMDECLTKFLEQSTEPLPYHTQVNICYDVALALAYLHFNGIIHRDLSSNNVLLIGAGSKAKVTDFGMSKFVDMNPRMTPLTQCPGTSAYMPPEALITPPNYSNKLDCFSHGVLTIQVITRNFPSPGDAHKNVTDPKYPTGRVIVQVPEVDRRKEDIDLIESDHPLLPIAFHCIKDWERERPSADELCEQLTLLKVGAQYTHSKDKDRNNVLEIKEQEIQLSKEDMKNSEDLQRKVVKYKKELEAKEQVIQRLQSKLLESSYIKVPEDEPVSADNHPVTMKWKQGKRAPETMSSLWGAAVVHSSTAYFSQAYNVYSYESSEDKWTKVQTCKHGYFCLAVINDTLTAIGGLDAYGECTNSLLGLTGSEKKNWKEIFPPMPTKREHATAVTTTTHLIVAGGSDNGRCLSTVEVMDMNNLQWLSLSQAVPIQSFGSMALCDEYLYISVQGSVYSCLFRIWRQAKGIAFTWKRLPNINDSATLATLGEHVLAIGGMDNGKPSGTVRRYDRDTNSWCIIGEMPTSRFNVLAAVLPSNELMVVGGMKECLFMHITIDTTEIGQMTQMKFEEFIHV